MRKNVDRRKARPGDNRRAAPPTVPFLENFLKKPLTALLDYLYYCINTNKQYAATGPNRAESDCADSHFTE
jgi:hypothetical protein